MPRRTYTIPARILKILRDEAEKRVIQLNMSGKVGQKTKGTVEKEIVCLCIDEALAEIKKMTLAEYENAVDKCMRKKNISKKSK